MVKKTQNFNRSEAKRRKRTENVVGLEFAK